MNIEKTIVIFKTLIKSYYNIVLKNESLPKYTYMFFTLCLSELIEEKALRNNKLSEYQKTLFVQEISLYSLSLLYGENKNTIKSHMNTKLEISNIIHGQEHALISDEYNSNVALTLACCIVCCKLSGAIGSQIVKIESYFNTLDNVIDKSFKL